MKHLNFFVGNQRVNLPPPYLFDYNALSVSC